MVRISDARMSGTAFGTIVLHIAPEAAVGGALALVRTGDRIRLDAAGRRIDLLVDDAELARRRAAWRPPAPHAGAERGYLHLFLRGDASRTTAATSPSAGHRREEDKGKQEGITTEAGRRGEGSFSFPAFRVNGAEKFLLQWRSSRVLYVFMVLVAAQSLTDRFAWLFDGLCKAIGVDAQKQRMEAALAWAIWNRVRVLGDRLIALVERVRAGRLPRRRTRTAAPPTHPPPQGGREAAIAGAARGRY